jgi:hypothetical protein
MTYKPYTPEWSRQRYLREALHSYIDDGVENHKILRDIIEILYERSSVSLIDFEKTNELLWMVRKNEQLSSKH